MKPVLIQSVFVRLSFQGLSVIVSGEDDLSTGSCLWHLGKQLQVLTEFSPPTTKQLLASESVCQLFHSNNTIETMRTVGYGKKQRRFEFGDSRPSHDMV